MIATRQLLSLFAFLPLIAFGAPATLQKDMSFTAARKLLFTSAALLRQA